MGNKRKNKTHKMEEKETRNSNWKKSQVDQNERKKHTKLVERTGKEEKRGKNGNQKTDCVHKLY